MKQLSFWGLMNPYKAQFIITIAQLILTAIAIYGGIWLFVQDIILPNAVFYTGLTLFFIAFACYPIRRARYSFWKKTFVKQKTMDAFLLASCLLMTITISNRDANIAWKYTPNQVQTVQIAFKTKVHTPVKSITFKEKLKKKYIQFVIQEKTADKPSKAKMIWGILGLLALTALSAVLVAGLVCSISCGGASPLGILVFGGGSMFVLTGLIALIRHLWGKRKGNYQPMPNTPTSN